MRQITEVLRLAAQGLSYRQIGQSLNVSPSTVQGYVKRAQRVGLSWPLPDDLDGFGLEERLFTRSEEQLQPGRPEPDWLEVHRERKRGKHVTLQLLWLEYKQANPDGWGYTQFCAHYHRWLGRQDVVMRFEYVAGERMFVDFCGGSPRVVVPDNLKSGVTKACWYDPELNRSYAELAEHFSMAILPARPFHPRDKPAIKAAVQVTEHWILAPLRKRQFFALAEANAAVAEQLALVNDRPFRGQPVSRRA